MFSVSIWDEAVPTLGLAAVAVLALLGGYWFGGDLWRMRHSIHIGGESSKLRISGAIGELAVLAMVVAGAFIVMVLCQDASLYHADGTELAFVILWFGCTYAGAYLYSRREISAGPESGEIDAIGGRNQSKKDRDSLHKELGERLRKAYRVYDLYTCVVFGLGGLALAKVALQFWHDWQINAAASRQLVAEADALLGIQPGAFDLNAIIAVERAYLSFRELLSDVLLQVEPIAFLFLYVMAMTLLVSMTPIAAAYRARARRLSTTVSLIAVIVLLGVSLGSYFLHATVASRGLAASLSHLQEWSATDHRHYMRYAEIYREVSAAGGVSGFIRALLSEAVFLVILVGIAQQAASRMPNLMGRPSR